MGQHETDDHDREHDSNPRLVTQQRIEHASGTVAPIHRGAARQLGQHEPDTDRETHFEITGQVIAIHERAGRDIAIKMSFS